MRPIEKAGAAANTEIVQPLQVAHFASITMHVFVYLHKIICLRQEKSDKGVRAKTAGMLL